MTDFAKLIEKAAAADAAVQKLHGIDQQLSPAAYVAAAKAEPAADDKQADRVIEFLDGPEAEMLKPSFRRVVEAIKFWRKSGPIRRINSYFDENGIATLSRLDVSKPSFFLAAARFVSVQNPEIFGTMSAPEKHEKQLTEAIAARDKAFVELETGWGAGDVDFVAENALTKQVILSFKVTGGDVLLQRNLARALVDWSMTQRTAKAA